MKKNTSNKHQNIELAPLKQEKTASVKKAKKGKKIFGIILGILSVLAVLAVAGYFGARILLSLFDRLENFQKSKVFDSMFYIYIVLCCAKMIC